jgi:hypothetical protein
VPAVANGVGRKEATMRIWIAVVEHRHGQNVYAARTKRKLLDQLHAYVKLWWDSEIPDEEMPTGLSKKTVIDRYFELVGHEWLETLTAVAVE